MNFIYTGTNCLVVSLYFQWDQPPFVKTPFSKELKLSGWMQCLFDRELTKWGCLPEKSPYIYCYAHLECIDYFRQEFCSLFILKAWSMLSSVEVFLIKFKCCVSSLTYLFVHFSEISTIKTGFKDEERLQITKLHFICFILYLFFNCLHIDIWLAAACLREHIRLSG